MSVVLRPVHAPDLGPVPFPRPGTRPWSPAAGGSTSGGGGRSSGGGSGGGGRSGGGSGGGGRSGGGDAGGGDPGGGGKAADDDRGDGGSPEREDPEKGVALETIRVVAWPDPVIDRLGYDPRSLYVETFWLGVLGPTSTWLLRRLAARFDDDPAGFDMDLDDTARALGLGGRSGRHAPFRRALVRCVTFEAARQQGPTTLAVRRKLPPLPRRHLQRLPVSLQTEHVRWVTAARRSPILDEARRRSRRLALGLLESGEAGAAVEAQLVRWQVHPAMAHEATGWAAAIRSNGTLGRPDSLPAGPGGLPGGAPGTSGDGGHSTPSPGAGPVRRSGSAPGH